MAAPLVFVIIAGMALIGDGPFATTLATGSSVLIRAERKRKTEKRSSQLHHDVYLKYFEGITCYHD